MQTLVNFKMNSRVPILNIREVDCVIDAKQILSRITLSVMEGEIVALLGPSGCGKTTLLRIIAGLENASGGEIFFAGKDLQTIPVHKRLFGMVFQDYALFPHKNVAENVAFGLKMRHWGKDQQDERVGQVLRLVGLDGFENRQVFDLSGGEQQRVALARSLAPAPQLLLLDEPLGALDRALREQLMGDLRRILKQAGNITIDHRPDKSEYDVPVGKQSEREGLTSIYVTHDQEEAFAVADRVVVMDVGHIEQVGKPVDLYRAPQSVFVAKFLGMDNQFEVEELNDNPPRVQTELGELIVDDLPEKRDMPMTLLIRPDAGRLTSDTRPAQNKLVGSRQELSFRGRHQILTLSLPITGGDRKIRLTFGSSENVDTSSERTAVILDPAKLQILTR